MTIKKLSSLPSLQNELISLNLSLVKMQEAYKNPYKKNIITDMPRGESGGGMEDKVIGIVDIETEIREIEQKINSTRKEINAFIESIKEQNTRDIIRFRCVNGMSFAEIGRMMGYTRSRIMTIFNDFFENFDEIQNK